MSGHMMVAVPSLREAVDDMAATRRKRPRNPDGPTAAAERMVGRMGNARGAGPVMGRFASSLGRARGPSPVMAQNRTGTQSVAISPPRASVIPRSISMLRPPQGFRVGGGVGGAVGSLRNRAMGMGRGLETPQVKPAFDPRTLLQPPPQPGMSPQQLGGMFSGMRGGVSGGGGRSLQGYLGAAGDLAGRQGGGGPDAMINRMREDFIARQQGGSQTPEGLLGDLGAMRGGVGKEGGRSPEELLGAMGGMMGAAQGQALPGGSMLPGGATLPGGTPTLQPPPNVPPGTTAITGNEVPYQVNPNRSSGLQGLIDQLTGAASGGLGGAGSELFGALESKALDRMRNPGGFDEELMRGSMDEVERRAGKFSRGLFDRVGANVADRGIDFSNIAADDFQEAGATSSRFFNDLMRPILQNRETNVAARSQADFANALGVEQFRAGESQRGFGNAAGIAGLLSGLERGERGELRGERAFNENLRGQARSQAIEEALLQEQFRSGRENEFTRLMGGGMGAGVEGLGAAGGAAPTLANLAGAYGGDEAEANQFTGIIAQLLGRGG